MLQFPVVKAIAPDPPRPATAWSRVRRHFCVAVFLLSRRMTLHDLTKQPLSERGFIVGMLGSWGAMLLLAVPVLKFGAFIAAAMIAYVVMRRRLMTLSKPAWIAGVPAVSYLMMGIGWFAVGKLDAPFGKIPGYSCLLTGAVGAYSALWLFEQGRKAKASVC